MELNGHWRQTKSPMNFTQMEICNSMVVVIARSISSSDLSEDMDGEAGRRPASQGREAPCPALAGRGALGAFLLNFPFLFSGAFCCQEVERRHGDGEEESSAECDEERRRFQGGCAGGRGSISSRFRLRVSPTRWEREAS